MVTVRRWQIPRRIWWGLACLAICVLSLLLSADQPLGEVDLCPVHRMSGLPCPGCGITRALICCNHGQWLTALTQHPLGPLLCVIFWLGASSLFWPLPWRVTVGAWHARHRERIERVLLVCIGLLTIFGILRIIFVWAPAPEWWTWSSGYAWHPHY